MARYLSPKAEAALRDLEVPEGVYYPVTTLPKHAGGRPTSYTVERGLEICELIEDGLTIDQIEAVDGMPAWETIRRWLRSFPEFQAQYARAREGSAVSIENEALRVARSATDISTAAAARIVVDTLKWMAAKRNPKVYGDKTDVNINGTVTVDVERRRELRQRLIGELSDLAKPAPLVIEHDEGES